MQGLPLLPQMALRGRGWAAHTVHCRASQYLLCPPLVMLLAQTFPLPVFQGTLDFMGLLSAQAHHPAGKAHFQREGTHLPLRLAEESGVALQT